MNNLDIAQTNSTPAITADWEAGTLAMRGDSYPENSFTLFQPVLDWVEAYLEQTDRPLHVNLELLYINTSSVRALMDILDMLEEVYENDRRDVRVTWLYEQANVRVAELAAEFKEDCSFPFAIVAIS